VQIQAINPNLHVKCNSNICVLNISLGNWNGRWSTPGQLKSATSFCQHWHLHVNPSRE